MPAGTVTNPTGSVNGRSLTDLVDADENFRGTTVAIPPSTAAQWQDTVILSNKPGVCSRLVNGLQTYVGGTDPEETVRLVHSSFAPYPNPAPLVPPTLPLTLDVAGPVSTSDGVQRYLAAYFNVATKNGSAGRDTTATAGTVTYTAISDAGCEGNYDLSFGADRVTGSFVAPRC